MCSSGVGGGGWSIGGRSWPEDLPNVVRSIEKPFCPRNGSSISQFRLFAPFALFASFLLARYLFRHEPLLFSSVLNQGGLG